MKFYDLPKRNLARKPGRTGALMALTAFLALAVFGGSVIVMALRSGLGSLEARLGADIIAVPSVAASKVSLKNMYLQGTVGAYYMDAEKLEKIRAVEGVEKAAPQVFLASLKADCCSARIQVIGFDPGEDFTIQPWIAHSYGQALRNQELVVGSNITSGVGDSIRIYDVSCPVVARLAPTGTGLDTAVYCNMDTVRLLLRAAEEKGVRHEITSGNVDTMISAVYVKVRDGYDVQRVNTAINRVRGVTPTRTRSMITDVSDGLAGVSSAVTALIAVVWGLAFIILLIVFSMMIHERKREFAVLRVVGMSRRGLSRMIRAESAMIGLAGGVIGVLAGCAVIFPFNTLIEQTLNLPYLLPGWGPILLLAALTLLLSLLIGPAASAHAARRLSRVDPGTILREGN